MHGDISEKMREVERNLCAEITLNFCWENGTKSKKTAGVFGLSKSFLLEKWKSHASAVPNGMDTVDSVLKLGVKNSK